MNFHVFDVHKLFTLSWTHVLEVPACNFRIQDFDYQIRIPRTGHTCQSSAFVWIKRSNLIWRKIALSVNYSLRLFSLFCHFWRYLDPFWQFGDFDWGTALKKAYEWYPHSMPHYLKINISKVYFIFLIYLKWGFK